MFDELFRANARRRAGWRCCLLGFLTAAAVATPGRADEPAAEGVAFFEKRIRPLLVQHCYPCHSAQAPKLKGGLRLDTRDGVRKGGATGPAVLPGDVGRSLLLRAVRYEDDVPQMPPTARLSAAEVADLEAWVRNGAPDPRTPPARDAGGTGELWSLRPVRDAVPPAVHDPAWALNPVDRFIRHAREAHGLTPVEPADRRTLLRRATFDLTGLPPTPAEVDAFLADDIPDAFARVVDRLLASPAYGERWGRHWLDVVRYSDTAGDNSDYPVPELYRYRNWVIRAFNRDLPYDEFVRQQLAGDLLAGDHDSGRADLIIATGYLANAHRFGSYEDERYPWHLTIEDTIDNFGRTFLGLTINCCRCHDHKFDPLTQEDYYALYGFFQSTRYPWPGIELDKVPYDLVPLGPIEDVRKAEEERRRQLAPLEERVRRLEQERAATGTDAKRKAEAARALKAARKLRDEVARRPLPFELAYAVAEASGEGKHKVGNACVQLKGDPDHPGKEVPRRFPAVLGGQTLPAGVQGSGRLELARWLTDPANPLFARVMVNRVWHYHFGKGLVPTPSDFGRQGRPPTHPELLDYLARRFVQSGWSVKALHRLVMLSRTYQLASREDEANAARDVANDGLWRFPRRRLDAESIRDTLLAVGGGLDRSAGGPHPFPPVKSWDFTQHNPFKAVYETNRRSVYLMTQRIQRHPYLGLFDGPDANASTDRRGASTTPLQSLYLMNDPFVHEQARRLAARLQAERSDDAGRVAYAYLLLFGRPATADEQAVAADYLARVRALPGSPDRAWESLVRALFLSNEFVYLN